MGFKLRYMQVKLFRKIRELTKADDIAQSMVDYVTERLPSSERVSEVVEVKAYWKYALYASYVQCVILSDNCEIKMPKEIYENFATKCLKALLETFYPELSKDDNTFANKALPDTYYSFKHRRVWAKLRRAAYFIQDAEDTLRSLMFDEVKYYKGIYDLVVHESENPKVETIEQPTQINEQESEQPSIAEAEPKPETVASPTKSKTEEEPSKPFMPDFSKFSLDVAIEIRESSPLEVESQPLVQVAKTIKSLCKVLSVRLMQDKFLDGLAFLAKLDEAVTGVS